MLAYFSVLSYPYIKKKSSFEKQTKLLSNKNVSTWVAKVRMQSVFHSNHHVTQSRTPPENGSN